ncbi:HAD domain-containing protein, partial [Porphyromonas loveana]|uniref:HAD domain-containing protein n=1 Tax=Porphyromonas loveana TaxID=1884669 RepID=UPI0035A0E16D
MQKVIFLDFDGVLNSGDNSRAISQLLSDESEMQRISIAGFEFDERCVRWLTYIINSTGAKIVISSSWRLNYTLEEMRAILAHFDL